MDGRRWRLAQGPGARPILTCFRRAPGPGLDPHTTVLLAGLHDSNASLLPHLAGRNTSTLFKFVSTGHRVCLRMGPSAA